MEQTDKIDELSNAMILAQKEMGGAVKDSANPFFHSKYADLESVIKVIKEPCSKHGLSYMQFPTTGENDNFLYLETVIVHTSGQWMRNTASIPMVKIDPQALGSSITYLRRYSLSAIFGIPQVDDDGEKAMSRGKEPVKSKFISFKERQDLFKATSENKMASSVLQEFLKTRGINSSNQIPTEMLEQVMSFMKGVK